MGARRSDDRRHEGRERSRHDGYLLACLFACLLVNVLQVYLVKKPVNFGPHFLVNESETR